MAADKTDFMSPSIAVSFKGPLRVQPVGVALGRCLWDVSG